MRGKTRGTWTKRRTRGKGENEKNICIYRKERENDFKIRLRKR